MPPSSRHRGCRYRPYSIPLGAGGHSVRFNGLLFEALAAIGASVGAVGHPEPFRPVLRALLLTGRYLACFLATGTAGAPLTDLV